MKRVTDLRLLFVVVAFVELMYTLITVLPPGLLAPATGWALSPDGHWITKLLCAALASQAVMAWTLRKSPPLGVAAALAFYQFASGTADWVMWWALRDQDIFSTAQARIGVLAAIPTHYLIGVLLVLGIRAARKEASR
jgi:hypothetical protein